MQAKRPSYTRGFSLVELSIVLVILGLLVGGILAGQSLIRASELRAVSAEYQRYSIAVNAFRDKYFAMPGDMPNAISFWGRSADCFGSDTPGTCNGNGDNIFQYPSAAGGFGEAFRAWQHLSLAGLIEGTYSGNAGPDNTGDVQIGSNSPRSKISNVGWMLSYRDNSDASSSRSFSYNYRNWMPIAAKTSSSASYLEKPFLRSAEAWNIDTKIDDGLPATGRVHAFTPVTTCTTAASQSDYTGLYKLADGSGDLCGLLFRYL